MLPVRAIKAGALETRAKESKMTPIPTATERPESAIHFSVFEYGRIAKLDGSVSNHKFTKMYNSWCLQRSGFSTDFVPLDASVYNALQVIFRDVYKHAMDRLHEENLLALQVGCYACHGAERKLVSMDGNFSWRRRKDRRPANNSNSEQGIFAPSRAEIALIAPPQEVDRFEEHTEVIDEECLLRDLDSDFKAGADHRRQNTGRFDECGVFSLNCARHGIVERVFDIFGGEGRKYALAAVDHVVKNLESDQKLGVMYDIVCLCQKRIEESIPLVQQHDPIYGVAIFHALAHSMNCQVKYFPRYVKGMALTDGESVERVWSHCNHFVGMSRNMSKANRHALLTQVLQQYADDKADSLASYIAKKYKKVKVTKQIKSLNMPIADYNNLEQEWLKHADSLCIFPGLEEIQDNAGRVEALRNAKVHYLILVTRYLALINKKTRINSGRKSKAFYIGAVILMFKLDIDGIGDEMFLLIRLGKHHAIDAKDKTMPIVELDENDDASAYPVCTFDQVICQVGLMRFSENNRSKFTGYHVERVVLRPTLYICLINSSDYNLKHLL